MTATDITEAPALDADVVIHAPEVADAAWVVQRPDDSYLRVGADMGRLLQAVDGVRRPDEIADLLGPPWTVDDVTAALRAAGGMELLAGTGTRRRPARQRQRRLRVVPPLTVQLALIRPEALARRVAPLLRAIPGRGFVAATVIIASAGLFALAGQTPRVQDALGTPQSLWVLAAVFGGTLFITGLHEFGHGLTLARYGGSPSRIGIMLFYLTPVFFCDVSDGWRLPRNNQRVMVALAGIGTQLVIAGVLAMTARPLGVALDAPDLTSSLLLLSVATYVGAILNLVPFVKFDGYIALMTHIDEPHLRTRAMTDARRALARLLFGGRGYRRELPGVGWAVAFGFACILFPVYLIAVALGMWSYLFVNAGTVGQVSLACLVGFLAYACGRGLWRLATEARSVGVGGLRLLAGGLVVVSLTVAALALVPVPYSVHGGFDCSEDGPRLTFTDGTDLAAISAGDPVTLREQGLVTATSLATTTVAGGPAARSEVAIGSLFPLDDVEIPLEAWTLALSSCEDVVSSGTSQGSAVVDVGRRPLGSWIFSSYLRPVMP